MMAKLAGAVSRRVRENWLVLLIVGALAVAFMVLRTPASPVASMAEMEGILNDGQPALVEFYANT